MSTRSCRLMRLTSHVLRKMESGRSNRLRGVSYCESVIHPVSNRSSKKVHFCTLDLLRLPVPLPEPRCDHSTPRSASDGRWKEAIHQHFDGLRLSSSGPDKDGLTVTSANSFWMMRCTKASVSGSTDDVASSRIRILLPLIRARINATTRQLSARNTTG